LALVRLLTHYMENILKVGNSFKKLRRYKSLFKRQKTSLFVNFGRFPCFGIRTRVPNEDPDTTQPIFLVF
jgi:hypothetical protein